jgi:plasmid stabilization system protein ParE
MTYRIILSPDARKDLQSVIRWYELEDIMTARRFQADYQATRGRIARHPLAFPYVKNSLRRAIFKTFPYCIYFTVSVNMVRIIAILHQHRAETHWHRRGNRQP